MSVIAPNCILHPVTHEIIPEPNVVKWAMWWEQVERRIVKRTHNADGLLAVSTVFLGFDHSFGGTPPQYFETMIFLGHYSDYCARYATWNEAVDGHEKAVMIWNGES